MARLTLFALALSGVLSGVLGDLSVASAKPILITRHTSGVKLKTASATQLVKASPTVLRDGQTLVIPEGGFVIALSEGRALKVSGPNSVTTSDDVFKGAAPDAVSGSSSLARVLTRQTSDLQIAATRSAKNIRIKHPMRGSMVAQLSTIMIKCSGCAHQAVHVIRVAEAQVQEEVLWRGHYKPELPYSGPALSPGRYMIKIAELTHPFEVASAERAAHVQSAVAASLRLAQSMSVTDRVSIESAIWHQSDMPSEAFMVLSRAAHRYPDNQELKSMLEAYQSALNTRQSF